MEKQGKKVEKRYVIGLVPVLLLLIAVCLVATGLFTYFVG